MIVTYCWAWEDKLGGADYDYCNGVVSDEDRLLCDGMEGTGDANLPVCMIERPRILKTVTGWRMRDSRWAFHVYYHFLDGGSF